MGAWQPATMVLRVTMPTVPPEDEGMAASSLGNTVPSGSLKVIWEGTHEPCPSPPS